MMMSLQIAADGCLDRLLQVWCAVVQRVYNYYQLSAKSYFTFLQLSAQVGLLFGIFHPNNLIIDLEKKLTTKRENIT